jgi:hypothetical protein
MAIASAIGGFITFVTNHWLGKWHLLQSKI